MAATGPFAADRRVMVAVSGGADSMALAWLLAQWGAPLAAVVDHGLRPAAAAEARLTAERLAAIGVPARILQANLSAGPAAAERARDARYCFLLAACRQAGCVDLLLGHHAHDQAETIRMREDAGSGAAGLAGIASVSYRADARLLRPLLGVEPERLRATLRAAGLEWAEDPTNSDLRTVRARLRLSMHAAAIAAYRDRSSQAGTARRAVERRAEADLAEVRLFPEGFAIVPVQLADEALSALIWTVSGRRYPPPRAGLAAGLAARTVHGVLIRPAGRLGPGTLVAREPAAAGPLVPMQAGLVWDGRFRIGVTRPGLSVGALGADAERLRTRSHLPSVVLQTLPAAREGGRLILVPHLAFPDRQTCPSVMASFAPRRPAAGAAFR